MTLEIIAAFAATSIVLSLAPGPDNIFVLTQSAMHGPQAGLMVTLGLATGLLFHTAAVVFGLAALIQVSVAAFTTLKVLGAAYLIYLAWKSFRAAPMETAGPEAGKSRHMSSAAYYRRGIIMNALNPKVSIFFLAFLPQFIDPVAGNIEGQMLILASVFFAVTLVVFSVVAVVAGKLGDAFARTPKVQNIINKTASAVFFGLAAKLLLTER
ncbi:LysE family translocator [Kordiimonas aquimaris]|uniref:LysE family translocator n=1 Tax=Kordiimonas aquimaris TaxID=707591 RepID=UPI0021D2BB3E|nr:LysE family translocator [Kordiimonas aquimaris]